jgi:hypothetical protein
MKKIELTIYKLSELSENAQEKAYAEWLESFEYLSADDNKECLDKFCKIFNVKVKKWEYGYRNYIDFEFNVNSRISELSGQRLATYLWNHYELLIYSKKYYSVFAKGKYKSRHSRIKLEKYSCPLTGYIIDNALLDKIWKFMDEPDKHRTFHDLIQEGLNNWIAECGKDYEQCQSFEAFSETSNANEWHYTEYGKFFSE